MPEYTRVEVEANPNSPMSAYQVYHNIGTSFQIKQVRIFEGEPEGRLCRVTGWTSEGGGRPSEGGGRPSEASAVQIEDSSQGTAYLVYGSDWGIRLARADSEGKWDIDHPDQWGETHLVLADLEDIVPL